jgi:DNA-binding response OmpR family regulator
MPRILLVEDDRDVRLMMEHTLLTAHYDVDTTETVDDALTLLDRRQYDLVLGDGRLNDGTGMIVAERAHERRIASLARHRIRLLAPASRTCPV